MKSREFSGSERIAFLGASRGLGWATYSEISELMPAASFFLSSRKILARSSEVSSRTVLVEQDYSKSEIDSEFMTSLQQFAPTRLIYFAAGGPYGVFETKKWSDHQWALNTSFVYPAQLLHQILSTPDQWPTLQQLVFVGSAIAEAQPDPMAASYAAAKHALKGLIQTVQKESSIKPDILLFSPGYMQTDMLPPHSKPRQDGLAEDPVLVAKKLIAFIEKND